MGNIESTQRQYTAEQLQQFEKADIQTLQILDSELFDDNFICQKVMHSRNDFFQSTFMGINLVLWLSTYFTQCT